MTRDTIKPAAAAIICGCLILATVGGCQAIAIGAASGELTIKAEASHASGAGGKADIGGDGDWPAWKIGAEYKIAWK